MAAPADTDGAISSLDLWWPAPSYSAPPWSPIAIDPLVSYLNIEGG